MNSSSPMYKLFICFILDTVNELPNDQEDKIKAMNLGQVLKVQSNDWRYVIKSALNLSDTIEIAIMDLWLKNSERAYTEEISLNSSTFANMFIENFYAENSRIDIWNNESDLIRAKDRIKSSYLSKKLNRSQ